MQNFENVEDLVSHMFEELDGDDPVSVVADKDLAVEIIKELLNYENVILNFANIDTYYYDKEYLVSLYDDTYTDYWYVSIEQIYDYENDMYFGTDGYVLFHEDVNSKALVDIQNNENIELSGYDWFVISENEETDDENQTETQEISTYTVNGKSVTKNEYNDFVSKFAPDKVIGTDDKLDDSDYSISVKCNLDADKALTIIEDMERRMLHINGILHEMDNFRRMFRW